MLASRIAIVLCISVLSVSWIHAEPNEQEAVENDDGFILLNDVSKWFKLASSPLQLIRINKFSDDSASKPITATTDNYFSEEGSGKDDSFSEEGSGRDDSFFDDGSGRDDFFDEEGSGRDDSSAEKGSGLPVLTTEDDSSGEVTSPSPMGTLEDFTFEEAASTTEAAFNTEANKGATKKIKSASQSTSNSIIIGGCVGVAIFLSILIIVIKEYCCVWKATQEKHGADVPFIVVKKAITK